MKSSASKGSVFDMLAAVKQAEDSNGALKVATSDIAPDPNQPRKEFDQSSIENLAASIKKMGVLQPITVRTSGQPSPAYFIVAGERRWRACKLAKVEEIPAYVRDDLADDAELLTIAQLAENMNRKDLSDYETAKAIKALIDASPDPTKHGLKGEIAEYLDRSRGEVSRLLKMLDPENVPLVEERLILSADALSRFRALDEEAQARLVEEARATKEPITTAGIRAFKKAAQAAPAAAEPAAAVAPTLADASEPSDLATSHSPDTAATGHSEDDLGAVGGAGDAGSAAADTGAAGDGFGDYLGDGSETDGAGAASDVGSARSGSTASTAPRAKAVALQVTGEALETLVRYFVDKASDRVEVRLPADLAVAIAENLGGSAITPDNPDQVAQTIKDLLAAKLG